VERNVLAENREEALRLMKYELRYVKKVADDLSLEDFEEIDVTEKGVHFLSFNRPNIDIDYDV
jgi:hypothetical protein